MVSNHKKDEHPEIPWHVMKCFMEVTDKECTVLNRSIIFDLIKDKLPRISGILEGIILKELENNDFNIEEYKIYAGHNSNNYMDLEDPFQD